MNFSLFWRNIINELSEERNFQTLKFQKPFTAKYVDSKIRVFPESTMHPRNISQEEFLQVWNQARHYNPREQFVRSNYNNITRNGSYILSIMRNFLNGNQIE